MPNFVVADLLLVLLFDKTALSNREEWFVSLDREYDQHYHLFCSSFIRRTIFSVSNNQDLFTFYPHDQCRKLSKIIPKKPRVNKYFESKFKLGTTVFPRNSGLRYTLLVLNLIIRSKNAIITILTSTQKAVFNSEICRLLLIKRRVKILSTLTYDNNQMFVSGLPGLVLQIRTSASYYFLKL